MNKALYILALVGTLVFALSSCTASAEYPERLIRAIVPFAPGGIGTRLSSELFQIQNKLKIEIIPYNGTGQAALALMTGEADFAIMDASPVLGQIAASKVRALAVAGEKRLSSLPKLPTTAEA